MEAEILNQELVFETKLIMVTHNYFLGLCGISVGTLIGIESNMTHFEWSQTALVSLYTHPPPENHLSRRRTNDLLSYIRGYVQRGWTNLFLFAS